MAKPLLDSVMMENGQGDRGLADPASTGQGDWNKVLGEIDYLPDQLVASEERSWGWRLELSRYAVIKYKIMGTSVVEIADLV